MLTLAGIKHIAKTTPAKEEIKYCKCTQRDCFICTFIWLHVFELTVTGWWIIHVVT